GAKHYPAAVRRRAAGPADDLPAQRPAWAASRGDRVMMSHTSPLAPLQTRERGITQHGNSLSLHLSRSDEVTPGLRSGLREKLPKSLKPHLHSLERGLGVR